MPLYQPGTDNLYESGLDNLINAFLKRNAVVLGCQVVAHAAPDMGVRVLAGTVQGGDTRVAVAQTDLVIDPNPGANQRIDLVSINYTTGVATRTTGNAAPAATLHPPALPATDILVGYVSVPAAAVNIQNANINDRRIFVPAYEDLQQVLPRPNLVLNSDMGRRTFLQLGMFEPFADLNGWTVVNGALGAVAANILTAGTNGRWSARAGIPTWRNGRWSASVKQVGTAVNIAGLIGIAKSDGLDWASNNNIMAAFYRTALNTVTLVLYKTVNGVGAVIAQQAGLTWNDGNWGWVELEAQGQTYIARLYNSGAAAGAKSAATLLKEISGQGTDNTYVAGYVHLLNDGGVGVATQWGGVAAGNGGVYLETPLPESFTFVLTGGGAAVGMDEAAESGPLGKQWALRFFIPHTSRVITMTQDASFNALEGVFYTPSWYVKTAGTSGTGLLIPEVDAMDANDAIISTPWATDIGQPVVWTRSVLGAQKTPVNTRRLRQRVFVNGNSAVTGTCWIMCGQLELGAVATAWRNAPSDDGSPISIILGTAASGSFTSVALVEIEPRDLAFNFFCPWDATLDLEVTINTRSSAVGNGYLADIFVDGGSVSFAGGEATYAVSAVANTNDVIVTRVRCKVVAGYHRIAYKARVTAGTQTYGDRPTQMFISATRAK